MTKGAIIIQFTSGLNTTSYDLTRTIRQIMQIFKIDETSPPEREWFTNYNGLRDDKESGHFILSCNDDFTSWRKWITL